MLDEPLEVKTASGAKQKYILFQRCRYFGEWPEDFIHQDDVRKITIEHNGEKVPLYLSFGVQTFDPPEYHKRNSPPQDGQGKGKLLPDPHDRPGFWVGNKIIGIAGPTISEIWFSLKHAKPGEVDFWVAIQCNVDLPTALIERECTPLLNTLVAGANIHLGDFIVPVMPAHLVKLLDDGQKQLSASYIFAATNRPIVPAESLREFFPKFLNASANVRSATWHQLNAAARRYLSSFDERDPVDRYCDLWESCEFLVKDLKGPDGRRIKGAGPVPRIVHAVSHQAQLSRGALTVLVQTLYNIRNDVVHNAVEHPDQFDSMTTYLELVTKQTFRFIFAMNSSPCPALAEYFDQKR